MKKKKGLEVILNIGLLVILLLLVSPFILTRCPFLVSADYVFITIGHSMTPAMLHGDTILVKRGIEDIRVGDIISFRVDSIPVAVAHRVVEIQENPSFLIFKTKGDANDVPDDWEITADQVIGKVTDVKSTSFFTTPYMLYASILLPADLILMRVAYCFFRRSALTKKSEYSVLNSTTAILAIILILSVGRLLTLLLSLMV